MNGGERVQKPERESISRQLVDRERQEKKARLSDWACKNSDLFGGLVFWLLLGLLEVNLNSYFVAVDFVSHPVFCLPKKLAEHKIHRYGPFKKMNN